MQVTLILTGKCNLSCSYCYEEDIFEFRALDLFDFDFFKENILPILYNLEKKVNTLGDKLEFLLFGGEPFLNKEFIIKFLDLEIFKRSKRVLITTNGIIYDKKLYDKLIEYKELIRITFSLDGMQDAFLLHRAKKQETYSIALKNALFLKEKGINVLINFVITSKNMVFLLRSLDYFNELGFKNIKFIFVEESFNTINSLKKLGSILLKALLEDNLYAKYLFETIFIYGNNKEFECDGGINNTLTILPTGVFTLCKLITAQPFYDNFGKIKNQLKDDKGLSINYKDFSYDVWRKKIDILIKSDFYKNGKRYDVLLCKIDNIKELIKFSLYMRQLLKYIYSTNKYEHIIKNRVKTEW